jgi:hypothetical protein
MNSKKTILIISIMIVSLCGIGGLLSEKAATPAIVRDDVSTLPPRASAITLDNDTIAPADLNINLTKDGINVTFTLQRIVEYIQNNTFKLSYINTTENGVVHTWKGINPLFLMQLLQWDAAKVNISASDGDETTFDTTHFLLRDPNFYKYSDYNATILVFAVTNDTYSDWLIGYNEGNRGAFRIMGDNLVGLQKIHHVVQIKYIAEWEVKVTVDGMTKGYLSRSNITSLQGLNYTTYDWAYYDHTGEVTPFDGKGSGWPHKTMYQAASMTGVTIASIVDTIGRLGDYRNYKVNLLAVDGYGMAKTFTKSHIENGFTGEVIMNSTFDIIDFSNEGKQPMLVMNMTSSYLNYNGEYLNYYDGPYMLIVPGAFKSCYIKEIVEIKITTIADSCPTCPTCPTCPSCDQCEDCPAAVDDSIPGYYPVIVIAALSIGIVFVIRKRS